MGFVLALAKLLINPLNKSLFDVSIMNQLNTEVDIPPEEEEEEEAKATHELPSHTIDQTKMAIEVERTEAAILHIEEENPFSKLQRYGTQKIQGHVEHSMQRTIDRAAKDEIMFHKRARTRHDQSLYHSQDI